MDGHMPSKIRKIRYRGPKFFGDRDEKWARGGGRLGYGRYYGLNKHGNNIDTRSKAEHKNANDRKLEQDELL
jgi:hypothetical protein